MIATGCLALLLQGAAVSGKAPGGHGDRPAPFPGDLFAQAPQEDESASQLNEEDMPKAKVKSSGEKTAPRRKSDKSVRRDLAGPDPIVRIGIMEEYDRIDFRVEGAYDLLSLTGEVIEKGLKPDVLWHIAPDQTTEARAVFSILTTAFAKKDSADKLRRLLSQQNEPARVVQVGEEIFIDDRLVCNNVKYRVLVGRWPTEREARHNLDPYREDFVPRIVRQIIRPATGTVELLDEDFNHSRLLENGFRLVPKDDSSGVTLLDVREGTGFEWEREVDRTYPGVMEFRVDHRGLLMALVELPLELYLKGVVPAEMPSSYPLEALKAQAVAARSVALSYVGLKHPNDPFDLCAHVHCQAFSGITHINERASKAVEDTRGYVITLDGQVAEAVFSACCGGHTEDKLNVWNPPGAPHLSGCWDAPDDAAMPRKLNLTREADVEQWVASSPPAWCNVSAYDDLPEILRHAEKNFRWQVSYSRRELEDIIRRKSGEDIGTLIGIVPLQRGESGRLMELEIQGTRRNLTIQRELNIRNILSRKYLKSACFVVDVEYGEDGIPINFLFRGAGWGHGVGLCQVGAGVMGFKGLKFKRILTHYYPGTTVERVYGD